MRHIHPAHRFVLGQSPGCQIRVIQVFEIKRQTLRFGIAHIVANLEIAHGAIGIIKGFNLGHKSDLSAGPQITKSHNDATDMMQTEFRPSFWQFWSLIGVLGAMVLFILFLAFVTFGKLVSLGPTVLLVSAAVFLFGVIVLSVGSMPPNAVTLRLTETGLEIWSRVTPKRGRYALDWSDINQIIVYRHSGNKRFMVLSLTPEAALRHGLKPREEQSYLTQLERVLRIGYLRNVHDYNKIIMVNSQDIGTPVLKLAARLVSLAEENGVPGTLKSASIMGRVQYHWEAEP